MRKQVINLFYDLQINEYNKKYIQTIAKFPII